MKPRAVSKLLTSSFFSLLLVSSLKYIPICTYIYWKVSGRLGWGAKDGGKRESGVQRRALGKVGS